MIDKALAYARSVVTIATEGQHEIAALFDAQFAENRNKTRVAALDQLWIAGSAGSEGVVLVRHRPSPTNAYEVPNKAAWQNWCSRAEDNLAADRRTTGRRWIANKDAT